MAGEAGIDVTWEVTGNIFGPICDQIVDAVEQTIVHAGDRYKKRARRDCPVSDIRTPGYVHLRDTIDYEADTGSLEHFMYLQMYVVKSYAEYVNNGTSRMAPRPFHTNGVLEVEEHYEDIVMNDTRELRMGRYTPIQGQLPW
jgi:HK97 gp10 family phage protein